MYGYELNHIRADRKKHTYVLGVGLYDRKYVDPAPDVAVQINRVGQSSLEGRRIYYMSASDGKRYILSNSPEPGSAGKIVILTPVLKGGLRRGLIYDHLWRIK